MVKWRGWQKEYIRQMMIWQLRTQRILEMHHFGEQLFTAVIVQMETRDSYRNRGCGKQEILTLNLLNTEDQWVLSAVVMLLLHSQHQKGKKKILKVEWRAARISLEGCICPAGHELGTPVLEKRNVCICIQKYLSWSNLLILSGLHMMYHYCDFVTDWAKKIFEEYILRYTHILYIVGREVWDLV